MKIYLVIISCLVSLSATAESRKLVSLTCTGANGLQISINEKSNIVTTQLGLFARQFESNRLVSLEQVGNQQITRISLGLLRSPQVAIYDIYLAGASDKRKKTTLNGVIGHTVNAISFVHGEGPVPTPVGFIPLTSLACNLLTR